MKNLENKEILSDDIMKAIDKIIIHIPKAVFGGSIALNAVGLLNRKISDIDLFFHKNESLSDTEFFEIVDNSITSDTVTNTNGEEIQRTGAKVDGVKVCCFKVSDEELQHSKYTFVRDGKSFTINLQNVNYAIEAKKAYAKHNQNPKHIEDLNNITKELDSFGIDDDLPF